MPTPPRTRGCNSDQHLSHRRRRPAHLSQRRRRACVAGSRYLARDLAAGARICNEYGDPYYPELVRIVDCTMPWGNDCVECL
jgi:hypothetical protein